jgi:hypothetical protein
VRAMGWWLARMAGAPGALALVAWHAAAAQVGYPPTTSPYVDLRYRQEISLSTGYYSAGKDPVGVAPGSGAMVSARYELRLSGPLLFSAGLARTFGDRTVVQFGGDEPRTTRQESWPIYLANAGFAVALTGAKSYHRLVPVTTFAAGLASDMGKGADAGGYKFGTTFAFLFDGGIRWLPSNALQFRATVADHWYAIHYPDSYFTPPDGGDPLQPSNAAQQHWTHNVALTFGVAYLIPR